MRTLNEHEDYYSRLSDVGEKLLDKIEAKLDKGEKISSETVADMAKAVGHMMKSEAKTIWMMKHHENRGEEL